jgi:hypothetical protein
VVDLIYIFYISWGKRQDILDQKIEGLFKEYQKLTDKCSGLNSKIDIILHKLEEAKTRQNIICKNNDYIKEEVLTIGRYLSKGKDSSSHSESRQDIPEIKRLVQEVKALILS